jgi:hypothetical protein
LRRAEGGANIFGVFRVKNHDFTPKNHIFTNSGGRRENCWDISFFAYNALKLWVRVMVFNVTLKQYVNYMVAISFIGNNPQYPKKTTNLPQVTEYIYHIWLYGDALYAKNTRGKKHYGIICDE